MFLVLFHLAKLQQLLPCENALAYPVKDIATVPLGIVRKHWAQLRFQLSAAELWHGQLLAVQLLRRLDLPVEGGVEWAGFDRCDKCSGFYIHVVLSLIISNIIRENLYSPLTIPL